MTKIKICGLRRKVDVLYINEFLPDYCGFILADGFFRQVKFNDMKELSHLVDSRVKRVGVFVNQDINEILRYTDEALLDLIQLHGNEDDDFIDKLRSKINNSQIKIIKAFRIKEETDIEMIENCRADYVLLDTFVKGKEGGSGMSFNWDIVKNVSRDYFLAGGINHENAKAAIEFLNPYALDASSLLETDRFKDKEKIRKYVDAVRG